MLIYRIWILNKQDGSNVVCERDKKNIYIVFQDSNSEYIPRTVATNLPSHMKQLPGQKVKCIFRHENYKQQVWCRNVLKPVTLFDFFLSLMLICYFCPTLLLFNIITFHPIHPVASIQSFIINLVWSLTRSMLLCVCDCAQGMYLTHMYVSAYLKTMKIHMMFEW